MGAPRPPEAEGSLIRYIEAAGENRNVDAKGPMAWDGGVHSASLAKDFMALANSRDGGVIVLGKSERGDGTFEPTGLSAEQATSFDTTKVATWVNNRCQPPIDLVCYNVTHQSKQFVIIVIKEFDDVPVICTRDFPLEKELLLRKGTVYVRTANAESAPLSTIDQLRALIGTATTKRADEMLGLFNAMLKGQPLAAEPGSEEAYATEINTIDGLLDEHLDPSAKKGAWTLRFHPDEHITERWPKPKLKELVDENAIRVGYRIFPCWTRNPSYYDRGLFDVAFADRVFAMSTSGVFVYREAFFENRREFKDPWQPAGGPPKPNMPEGAWFEFQVNMFRIIEFFWFMSRMAHALGPDESVVYDMAATGLRGRHLVTLNSGIYMFPYDVCQAPEYRRHRELPSPHLRAAWEDECVDALSDFFMLFAGDRMKGETLREWVTRFKDGKF